MALQSGTWAAENILADFAGEPRRRFRYHDKGIMAMIGRGAAIAEVGAHRHQLRGVVAFAAWLSGAPHLLPLRTAYLAVCGAHPLRVDRRTRHPLLLSER